MSKVINFYRKFIRSSPLLILDFIYGLSLLLFPILNAQLLKLQLPKRLQLELKNDKELLDELKLKIRQTFLTSILLIESYILLINSLHNIFIKRTSVFQSFLLLPLSLFFIITIYIWGLSQINKTTNIKRGRGIYISGYILFPLARQSIKILSGSFNPQFYGHPTIIHSLSNAYERGINIKIIFSLPTEENAKKKVIDLLENKYSFLKKGTNLFIFPEFPNDPHFAIVDRWHARMEQVHIPFWERKGKDKIKARLYFWSPILVSSLNRRFKEYFNLCNNN